MDDSSLVTTWCDIHHTCVTSQVAISQDTHMSNVQAAGAIVRVFEMEMKINRENEYLISLSR